MVAGQYITIIPLLICDGNGLTFGSSSGMVDFQSSIKRLRMKVNVYACIGKSGQLGLGGEIPFYRRDEALVRAAVRGHLCAVGERSIEKFDFVRPEKLIHFNRLRTPEQFRDAYHRYYYDKDLWILGGETTYKLFAPLVNGRVVLNVVDYDGPADAWFPFTEYGLRHRPKPSLVMKGEDNGRQVA